MFVLDVCQTENNEFKIVVEINSINSSGIYECSCDDFVNGFNLLVLDEWRKVNDPTYDF
jgi:hypothetical protein